MSVAHNQLRIARELWSRLQPLDRNAPSRLQGLLADRRFGSRDRRLYRELLFTALRHARVLAKLDPADETAWAALLARACAATRETEAFRATFSGSPAAQETPPAPSDSGAPQTSAIEDRTSDLSPSASALELMPPWFVGECELPPGQPSPAGIAAALLARAPVWVRMQTDSPDDAHAEWAARGWVASPHPALPEAWKLPPETNLSACETYQSGHYEIQDLGSQLILASLDLPGRSPGPRWLDACAGAGGKTLQLARLLGPSARIDAADVRPAALSELRTRVTRSGLGSRVRTLPRATETYDGVLVDAPCSGSGTWRRAPHLMACTTEADLVSAASLQTLILAESAERVRPGGLLVYATCSIARRENEAVAAAFLASHEGRFESVPPARDFGFPRLALGLSFTPGLQDNDGFYVAAFHRL